MMYTAWEIVVPRDSRGDMLTAETFFSGLAGLDKRAQFAFEFWGDARQVRLIARASDPSLGAYLSSALQAAWPQAELVPLSHDTDPAVKADRTLDQHPPYVFEMRMREMPFIPIKTHITREGRSSYDDLSRQGDPMLLQLSAVSALDEHERAAIQFYLTPINDEWGKLWRGSESDIHNRLRILPPFLLRMLMLVAGWALIFVAALLGLLTAFVKPWMVQELIRSALIGAGGIALVLLALRLPPPPDPDLIEQKIRTSAFRVCIRVFVWATSPTRMAYIRRQIEQAFAAYGFPTGNALVAVDSNPSPFVLQPHMRVSRFHEIFPFFSPLMFGKLQYPILSASEMASLWHIPHGNADLPKLNRGTSKRIATGLPIFLSSRDGVYIGHLNYPHDRRAVYLPRRALHAHIGLIGSSQSGKTNMMALLARHIMETEPESTIIVLDPHSTLASAILHTLPKSRATDAIYVSFANDAYTPVLNLLDQSGYPHADVRVPDKHISDIVESLQRIWADSWGPRMEEYLRESLDSLLLANQVLWREHNWLQYALQFTATTQEFMFSSNNTARPLQTRAFIQALRDHLKRALTMEAPGSLQGQYTHRMAQEIARHAVPWLETLEEHMRRGHATTDTTLAEQLAAIADEARELNEALNEYIKEHVQVGEALASGDPNYDVLWQRDAFLFVYQARCLPRLQQETLNSNGTISDQFFLSTPPLQFTILDVPAMLSADGFRPMVIEILQRGEFFYKLQWWQNNYDALLKTDIGGLREIVRPVLNKLNKFIAINAARRVFGGSESTIRLNEFLNQPRILIFDLAEGIIGRSAADLIGSMLLNQVVAWLYSRQRDMWHAQWHGNEQTRQKRVYVFVDEFQTFRGADYTVLLTELAKFGATTVMGTQALSLLKQGGQKGEPIPWLENVRTLFVFHVSAENAAQLARELNLGGEDGALRVHESDIVGLSDYHCFLRATDDEGRPHVISLRTASAREQQQLSMEEIRHVIEVSALNYQRPAPFVDQQTSRMLSFHISHTALPSAAPRNLLDLGKNIARHFMLRQEDMRYSNGASEDAADRKRRKPARQ